MVEVLAASGLAGSMGLFGYNRENFFFDREQKQKREFQEQNMRVEQFGLYREDVRDLVELTVSKMDLYLIMGALLVDKTFMMICKQAEAFPADSPEWVVAMNSLSLSSAVFYLLLTLWLAMYASISAQSFGTRLLTQFVRLPIVDKEQLDNASASATDFEAKGVTDMLRVPVLQKNAAGVTREVPTGGAASSQALPAPSAPATAMAPSFTPGGAGGAVNLLPTAMLDHISLYRRVQLNWQAYDAYARVSLFCGANAVLYCCLYWCLGEFLQKSDKAQLPAIGVAAIFATCQLVLSRLDLRLRRRETVILGVIVFLTPLVTTCGMILNKQILQSRLECYKDPITPQCGKVQTGPDHQCDEDCINEVDRYIDHMWQTTVMNVCAFVAHCLHTCVCALILKASWPDEPTSEEDALLPGKFRSTLYLDVFGWLMNPGVKKSGSRAEGFDSFASTSGDSRGASSYRGMQRQGSRGTGVSSYSRTATGPSDQGGVSSNTNEPMNRRTSMDLTPDLANEAHRLLTPSYRPATTATPSAQVDRFGGAEAMSTEQMADISAPTATAATQFHGAHAPRKVSKNVRLPGETPWRAFCQGTVVILLMWATSTVWCFLRLVTHQDCGEGVFTFWCAKSHHRDREPEFRTTFSPLLRAVPGTLTHQLACSADSGPLALRLVHTRKAEVSVRGPEGKLTHVVDAGCGLRRQIWDVGLACQNTTALDSGDCVAALLRRGGRVVSLCQLQARGAKKTLMLSPIGSFRLTSGIQSLQSIAVALGVGRSLSFGDMAMGHLADVRVFGRVNGGSLLALRPFLVAAQRGHLLPEFELETAQAAARRSAIRPADSFPQERLFAVRSGVLSVTPLDEDDHCTADAGFGGSLQLLAWNTTTGEQVAYRSLAVSLRAMCSPSDSGQINPDSFLMTHNDRALA